MGYDLQFGSTPKTGCPDANLLLKSTLQLRREFDQDSWVVFLDLVKAFDTVDHTLLLKLMSTYGIPKNIVRIVEKLYNDFNLKLKIGNESSKIPYLTGVKQGNALAPTLFLFIMQAMAETVLEIWKKENITPFTYKYDHKNEKMITD